MAAPGRVRRWMACLSLPVALVLCAWLPADAQAAGPAWHVVALSDSTVAPGGSMGVLVEVKNIGDAPLDASAQPLQISVTLPVGLKATSFAVGGGASLPWQQGWSCFGTTFPASSFSCSKTSGTIPPYDFVNLTIPVAVSAVLPTGTLGTMSFAVSGGGGTPESTVASTTISTNPPSFEVAAVDGQTSADASGAPDTQSGGHPYASSVSVELDSFTSSAPSEGDVWPVEPLRDAVVDLPPGLVGNPTAAAQCTVAQLGSSSGTTPQTQCPPESQVGTVLIRLNGAGVFPNEVEPLPVFNITPTSHEPARFGFNVAGSVVLLDTLVRPSDYGVSIVSSNIPEALPIVSTSVTLWGAPASSAHDVERACPGDFVPFTPSGASCKSSAAPTAFIRNPTSCSAPAGSPVQDGLVTALHADSWEHPGALTPDGLPDLSDPNWKSASFTTHLAPYFPFPSSQWGADYLPTGCDQVPFDPTISVSPTTEAASSPSGLNVDLSLPQPNDPNGIAESDLKQAIVTLPPGMTINPSEANGLGACTLAQIGLGSNGEPACPDDSKIGTVQITTPLLANPLSGSVYLAKQADNPFGSLLAMYIVADGPGFVLKLAGRISPDPSTGQLVTTFDDQPQLPFSDLQLSLFGGDLGPLVTPASCGTYSTNVDLAPWARPDNPVSLTSPFTVTSGPGGGPCSPAARPFAPRLSAGMASPVADAYSSFALQLTRSDVDREIASVTTQLPPGLLARIAGVPLCPDALAAGGVCGDASLIGHVTVGAGAGPSPFYIQTGKVFLTTGYKGAPFGLDITVPALAGPFDLGVVNVRAALNLDPSTAQASVASDPLPRFLQGIPVLARDIRVTIDRPAFTLNPTSCDPMSVGATVGSFDGAVANLANRFQVGRCSSLRYSPKLQIRLSGRGQTRDGAHPTLNATLTQPAGQANNRSVQVALPLSLALDPYNSQHVCSYDVAQAVQGGPVRCPANTVVGSATASTPLLSTPLSGRVYLVQGIRFGKQGQRIHTLPTLLVALRGQIAIDLRASSSVNGAGQLVSSFSTIPDAPVSRFTLQITGRRRGILVVTHHQNLCTATQDATVQMTAQNGRTHDTQSLKLATPCPAHAARQHKRRQAHAHNRR